MKYVGLTDDPDRRRQEHGNPSDWWQRSFSTEAEARRWEKEMLSRPGYTGNPGGAGGRIEIGVLAADLDTIEAIAALVEDRTVLRIIGEGVLLDTS